MSFVGRFICIEKFNLCMSCCPLNRSLFGLQSTNGGFTVVVVVVVVEVTCINLGLSLGFPLSCVLQVYVEVFVYYYTKVCSFVSQRKFI